MSAGKQRPQVEHGCSREGLASCIRAKLLGSLARLRRLVLEAVDSSPESPWESVAWQAAKSIIARAAASCICRLTGCHVYLLDMHGGEPSEGLGGKDVDLAVECPGTTPSCSPRELEDALEAAAAEILDKAVGGDARRMLKIPNIVEVHSADEFLIKRYVELGPPYSRPLC